MELMRWDIINALIEKNNYKRYLEIGYYKGWSFDQVKCEAKLAVDPNPCKNPIQESTPYGASWIDRGTDWTQHVIKLTSDDYFKDLTPGAPWDIIFIDGLHEAEQVYRDIENSLKHLSPNGTIVLHDCNPPLYEHTTTGIDGCWTGDTYKAVLGIENKLFGYNFHTVDTDWGVGILTALSNLEGRGTHAVETSLYATMAKGDWNYFDKNRKKLLNLITPEQFKQIYVLDR